MAELASPITISEMPQPDERIQILISTSAEFASIYLTPETALALGLELVSFFGAEDDDEPEGDAA